MRASLAFFTAFVATILTTAVAAEDAYPSRAVRVLAAFGAGGTTDAYARIISKELQGELGQSFVVENVTGASGLVAATRVAKASADAYMLLFTTNAFVISPALRRKMPFDPVKDFTPLAMVVYSPNMLVVKGDSRYKAVSDYLAAAKASPSGLSYASAGFETSTHLVAEQFGQLTGTHNVQVPYNATSAMAQALLAGDVDSIWLSGQAIASFLETGQLRALAVADDRRSRFAPDAPTFEELGYKGFVSGTWNAFFGPANLPGDIANKLARTMERVVMRSQVQEELLRVGADRVRIVAGAEFENLIPKEIEFYKTLVRDSKIEPID